MKKRLLLSLICAVTIIVLLPALASADDGNGENGMAYPETVAVPDNDGIVVVAEKELPEINRDPDYIGEGDPGGELVELGVVPGGYLSDPMEGKPEECLEGVGGSFIGEGNIWVILIVLAAGIAAAVMLFVTASRKENGAA